MTGAESHLTDRDCPLKVRLRPGKITMAQQEPGEVA
jgi:hypothetical protein